MTDNPELVATADLTPESPRPINLSSPTAVPTLQDQADNLSTMALSPSEDMPTTELTSLAQSSHEPGNAHDHVQAVDATAITNAQPSDASPGLTDTVEIENGEVGQDHVTNAEDEDEDEYAKDFDSPVPDAEEAVQAGEVNGYSKPATDDLVKPETSLSDPSHPDTITSTSPPVPASVPEAETQTASDASQSTATVTQNVAEDTAAVESAVSSQSNIQEAIDIQALVDNITARHTASESVDNVASEASETPVGTSPTANAQSSLPPKPPASHQSTAVSLLPEELHRFQPNASASGSSLTSAASLPYSYPPGATPAGYAPPPPYPGAVPPMPLANPYSTGSAPGTGGQSNQSQRYDDFLKEERKYVSEAKWDRFPEGSRLFIGNLSSERVSKKEVFDIFSQFGRLAQISLKQAYGFVQYHTILEGQAATDALQGTEISGRKIHLEFSRAQKKGNDGDSNDRRGNRGERGGRGGHNQNDRGDRNRFDNRRGDGYRPRSPSPTRGNHSRQGSYSQGNRGHWEPPSEFPRRGRSRSPTSVSGANYRRRSPSPYRRGPPVTEADLEIPRRYGPDVPDLQLLLLQDVNRDFVGWVQSAFIERGLKVDVMFLNPRFPRDLVIQRQVVEGVHGVIELDFRSQTVAKVPLQTFDRSAGRHNARFDQYQDLDPKIAAEIVARAKSQSQLQSSASYNTAQYSPVNYPPQPQMAPQHYPGPHSQPPANLNLGGLDNATLQRVLSAVQGGPQGGIPGQPHMGGAPGVDVNAVLSALGANGAAVMPSQRQSMSYPPAPASGNPADQAHVQNIMAQLSRYRQ